MHQRTLNLIQLRIISQINSLRTRTRRSSRNSTILLHRIRGRLTIVIQSGQLIGRLMNSILASTSRRIQPIHTRRRNLNKVPHTIISLIRVRTMRNKQHTKNRQKRMSQNTINIARTSGLPIRTQLTNRTIRNRTLFNRLLSRKNRILNRILTLNRHITHHSNLQSSTIQRTKQLIRTRGNHLIRLMTRHKDRAQRSLQPSKSTKVHSSNLQSKRSNHGLLNHSTRTQPFRLHNLLRTNVTTGPMNSQLKIGRQLHTHTNTRTGLARTNRKRAQLKNILSGLNNMFNKSRSTTRITTNSSKIRIKDRHRAFFL